MLREHIARNNLNPDDYPVLASQPKLFPDLMWIWDAFSALSASRQRGYASLQPIPIVEIAAYCAFKGIYLSEDREALMHYVQYLDVVFMRYVDAQSKKK